MLIRLSLWILLSGGETSPPPRAPPGNCNWRAEQQQSCPHITGQSRPPILSQDCLGLLLSCAYCVSMWDFVRSSHPRLSTTPCINVHFMHICVLRAGQRSAGTRTRPAFHQTMLPSHRFTHFKTTLKPPPSQASSRHFGLTLTLRFPICVGIWETMCDCVQLGGGAGTAGFLCMEWGWSPVVWASVEQ